MKLLKELQSFKAGMGLLLLIAFLVVNVNLAEAASKPRAPKLSLTGSEASYDSYLYPDGRIWLPPNDGQPREFLLPVFIQHQQWYTFYYDNPTLVKYVVKPIESFQFSLMYNETAIRAMDVITSVPDELKDIFPDAPLAENFHFSVDEREDDYYWNYLNPDHPSIDKENGRRFIITGTSNMPLTVNNPNSEEHLLLLFVKFKVMYDNTPGQQNQFNKTSPIYFDDREVFFNEVNFITEPAWKCMYEYNQQIYQIDYPGPSAILSGITNNKPSMQNLYQKEPYQPGTIWLNFSDQSPEFDITSTQDEVIKSTEEEGLYTFSKPITVDSNSTEPAYGSRIIQLLNKTALSRLNFINVESSADWLQFRTVQIGDESKQPPQIRNFTTKGTINYIDNGIIGITPDPVGDVAAKADGDVFVEIKCDPELLDVENGEATGIYTGYLTFRSLYAGVSPVRLKIRFIYIKNPFEPAFTKPEGYPGGIYMDMYNGNQFQRLVFGTGTRATDAVDPLYGEEAYTYPMSTTQFAARFFPFENEDLEAAIPYGFGDFAANEANRRSNSRDIRSYDDNLRSITYYVKFNRADDNLPVIIEWDIRAFPAGSQLYLREILNGEKLGSVNMRTATEVNQFIRSFTIVDARIKEFVIEYTLPKVIDYVDNNGNPIIKKGWNLLSLPVRPTDNTWNTVYPNAINIPWTYNQNNYQQEEELRPGVGYFVKYGDYVDVKFAGSYLGEVSVDNLPVDPVRVYPGDKQDPDAEFYGGWNSVGALSVPVDADDIEFTNFQNETPDRSYTMNYGVWGYDTDNGYKRVSQLMPGLGYWIKTNKNGYYKLVAPPQPPPHGKVSDNDLYTEQISVESRSVKVTISDVASTTDLYVSTDKNISVYDYEMPPVPMKGLFDVRFASNTYLTNINEPVIKVQGADLPLNVTINNADANYDVLDAVTGKLLGTVNKGETKAVIISELPYGTIKLAKTSAADANSNVSIYPNPVVASSTVNFNVPANGNVKVELFDELGNNIQTVVNEFRNAGDYSETLDASDITSGNYMLKVSANGYSEVIRVNVVK